MPRRHSRQEVTNHLTEAGMLGASRTTATERKSESMSQSDMNDTKMKKIIQFTQFSGRSSPARCNQCPRLLLTSRAISATRFPRHLPILA